MKAGENKAKPKSKYVNTENPELRKVVKALRGFVKEIEPATEESVNAWGGPPSRTTIPSVCTWSASIM
jgi:uncharacterized protein YdhG (YjbR/CyaY superfamily)